jgi:hypothetical protein
MKKKIDIRIHLEPINYNHFKKEALEQNRTTKNLIETFISDKLKEKQK